MWLGKYKQLLLFKPSLGKAKIPLCQRKPGIWTYIVATFLSLPLKSLSCTSCSQFNYCNRLFTLVSSFARSSLQQSAHMLCCAQWVLLWTISWSLIELYFTSISLLLFHLFPGTSVTVVLHVLGMLNAFSAPLSSFCFMTSFVLLYTPGVLRQKGWDRASLLHCLPGRSFIPGNLFYCSHLSLFCCFILNTYPTAWIAINMNCMIWQFLPCSPLIYISAKL